MKKTYKLIFCILITSLLLFISTFSTFASYEEQTFDSNKETYEIIEATETKNEDEKNVFSALFAEAEKHAAEILSSLSFVASLVIMFCYKKGFLPLVQNGINSLGSGVRNICDNANELLKDTEAISSELSLRIESVEKSIENLIESLKLIDSKISKSEEKNRDIKNLKKVTECQIDMLYEIFSNAALPHYLKENMGEKISKMKSDISNEEA